MYLLPLTIVTLIALIYKNQEKALLFGKKIPEEWKPSINYDYEEIYIEMLLLVNLLFYLHFTFTIINCLVSPRKDLR